MSDNIYVIGVGMIKFGKHLDKGMKQLSGDALDLVLKDCDLGKDDIEAAWYSNSGWGQSEFQHCIRGEVALSANGLDKIPMINVENACASGSTALHSGWMAIKAGVYDCVLAIGAEKMYFDYSKASPERQKEAKKMPSRGLFQGRMWKRP
jgi:acetyl-CoA acyltransferase